MRSIYNIDFLLLLHDKHVGASPTLCNIFMDYFLLVNMQEFPDVYLTSLFLYKIEISSSCRVRSSSQLNLFSSHLQNIVAMIFQKDFICFYLMFMFMSLTKDEKERIGLGSYWIDCL